jgi:hypothetical protein
VLKATAFPKIAAVAQRGAMRDGFVLFALLSPMQTLLNIALEMYLMRFRALLVRAGGDNRGGTSDYQILSH